MDWFTEQSNIEQFIQAVKVELDADEIGGDNKMKPSDAQIKFFDKLLDEKDFGDKADVTKLREKFSGLNQKSASAWIEKALSLPKRDESGEETVPPAF